MESTARGSGRNLGMSGNYRSKSDQEVLYLVRRVRDDVRPHGLVRDPWKRALSTEDYHH